MYMYMSSEYRYRSVTVFTLNRHTRTRNIKCRLLPLSRICAAPPPSSPFPFPPPCYPTRHAPNLRQYDAEALLLDATVP